MENNLKYWKIVLPFSCYPRGYNQWVGFQVCRAQSASAGPHGGNLHILDLITKPPHYKRGTQADGKRRMLIL
jgi:hypothetical protein